VSETSAADSSLKRGGGTRTGNVEAWLSTNREPPPSTSTSKQGLLFHSGNERAYYYGRSPPCAHSEWGLNPCQVLRRGPIPPKKPASQPHPTDTLAFVPATKKDVMGGCSQSRLTDQTPNGIKAKASEKLRLWGLEGESGKRGGGRSIISSLPLLISLGVF
ncbi:hypothetical protein KUCAC02_036058, partial [Chaenocephalus aceratus]